LLIVAVWGRLPDSAPGNPLAGRPLFSMRLLDRYIARQVFISALYAVAVIIIILVLGNVFKEILRQLAKRPDISLGFVLKFIVLVIPISLSLAIPFSFLTAILLTFGRLSADSEFVSMRMAGLSMWRICLPVAVVALFFSGVCAWVNLSVTPAAKTAMEGMKNSLINRMKREPMLLFPNQQVMSELPDHLVFARKEDGILKGLQLIRMEDNVPMAIAVAREARVRVELDSENPELVLDMSDVNLMVKGDEGNFMDSSQPVFMASGAAGVSIEDFKARNERAIEQPDNVSLRSLIQKSKDPGLDSEIRASYRTELSVRFAFSVSCLTFGLIGVPLGITAQRRESTAGFILSMIIAVSYYVMLTIAKIVQDREELYPHLLVWVPNILFFALGISMFLKLAKK
jgi:lipopolysaccharide export LptBFGC system permease protein LptF